MIVNTSRVDPAQLDVGYLALFTGMQMNRLVLERMHAAGFDEIRESHGYLIQHLIEKERSITELARRMKVSQQAASKQVAELAELGALDVAAAADRRQKTVRLSPRGRSLVELSRKHRRQIEKRLIRAAGEKAYRATCAILSQYLESLGGWERVRSRRVLPPQ